jgi:hypothetical protein
VPLAAQNLIPNPSFEDTVQLNFGLTFAKHWIQPTLESPNHLHPDSRPEWRAPSNITGFQQSHSGVSHIGLKLYNLYDSTRDSRREYIQVKLNRSLSFDSIYCLRLYVSLADSFYFASRNQLGIYLSNTAVTSNTHFNLPYTPQIIVSPTQFITDKTNWLEYNFQYQALGGEEYITVGNFNDTTSIDTLFVPNGGNQFWHYASYYYLDDFWLSDCDSLDLGVGITDEELEIKNVELWPNPIQESFTLETSSKKLLSFQLYNVLGSAIPYSLKRSRDLYHFSVGDIPKGIYFLRVSDGIEQASFKIMKE